METLLRHISKALPVDLDEKTRLVLLLRIAFNKYTSELGVELNNQEILDAITKNTSLSPKRQRLTPPAGSDDEWQWLMVDALNSLTKHGTIDHLFGMAFVDYADRWLQGQKMNV